MAIWSSEIKELEKLYESIKGHLPDLEKELERLIKADDENMILLYSRRCLEVIITDLCECELKRERGTEPLKGVADKLNKDKKIPPHIASSMYGLNELSTYGAHPKDFDLEQVKPVLVNLHIIIKWYLKYKNIVTVDKTEVDEEKIQQRKELLEEIEIKERTEGQEKPAKAGGRRLISMVTIVAILIIAIITAYPKIFKRDTVEKLNLSGERISVVVMPFQNMTNDTTWNIWQDGVQDMLITFLSNSPEEIIVRQAASINYILQDKGLTSYASITPSIAGTISQSLDADVFIYGNIKQAGSSLRLYAQLIDSKSEEVFKSFQIECPAKEEDIFQVIDSLSIMVRDFLVISLLDKKIPVIYRYTNLTNSPEAYRYFLYGNKSLNIRDYPAARNWYQQALDIDSNITTAAFSISISYANQGLYKQGKQWCLRVYEKMNLITPRQKAFTNWLYSLYFGTPYDEIKYLEQALEMDKYGLLENLLLGISYAKLNKYDKAIPEYERCIELPEKMGIKQVWTFAYTGLGTAYHKTGQLKKEKNLYKKAEQDFPDDPPLLYNQALLSLTLGETNEANLYIERYISIRKNQSWSEARISNTLAQIYSDANIYDKAEEFYRKALTLEPDNPVRMNSLAYFLADMDRNIPESLELVGMALKLNPDNYDFLDTKGWGLYKQGKFQEALEVLQKSWDLRRQEAIYNHEAFLHLEAAEKAVAGMN